MKKLAIILVALTLGLPCAFARTSSHGYRTCSRRSHSYSVRRSSHGSRIDPYTPHHLKRRLVPAGPAADEIRITERLPAPRKTKLPSGYVDILGAT